MKTLSRIFLIILILLMGYFLIFNRNTTILSLLGLTMIFSSLLFNNIFNKKEE